ncbi:hypothetical protein KDX38_20785 [Pseudomonas sp. CDFA 602]|uniref:hypothetical protein n=1 Tax=Pseudomonas californiensis TaxID=2829823 RepID=UPI001E3ED55C|nr:hypothetical protein [Pseudomonas californiensis]MCD6001641.1 hypothetical protein [Pseudomonas californiensis]
MKHDHRQSLPLQDEILARLLTFPDVVMAALTKGAPGGIAQTTFGSSVVWSAGTPQNRVEG